MQHVLRFPIKNERLLFDYLFIKKSTVRPNLNDIPDKLLS